MSDPRKEAPPEPEACSRTATVGFERVRDEAMVTITLGMDTFWLPPDSARLMAARLIQAAHDVEVR